MSSKTMQRCLHRLMVVALALGLASATGQTAPRQLPVDGNLRISTYALWEGKAPGAKGDAADDVPSLSMFPPRGKGNGTAVIIAPGGAYKGLAADLEGREPADWFAARGFTAFVLRYRLGGKYPYPVPLEDAQRAVRLVRSMAAKWSLQPDRIGFMGFSAGGTWRRWLQ